MIQASKTLSVNPSLYVNGHTVNKSSIFSHSTHVEGPGDNEQNDIDTDYYIYIWNDFFLLELKAGDTLTITANTPQVGGQIALF
jgi:hypothetical protein